MSVMIWLINQGRQIEKNNVARSGQSVALRRVSMSMPLIATCMMTGCASGTPPTPTPLPPMYPASLLVKCPTLPMATSGKLVDLINNHIDVAERYHDCASTHNNLVDLIHDR